VLAVVTGTPICEKAFKIFRTILAFREVSAIDAGFVKNLAVASRLPADRPDILT
jgi:hypothetical protein